MTIGREHLKQAIDLIAAYDRAAGRDLEELLATGRLGPAPASAGHAGRLPAFAFLDETVTVQRGLLFDQRTEALAERLLVKYGELLARRLVAAATEPPPPAVAGRAVHAAGPRFLVEHQLRRALAATDTAPGVCHLLESLLAEDPSTPLPWEETDPAVLFPGVVGVDSPAVFLRFPWRRRALEEAAALDLEFFAVGRLLRWLARDETEHLFAASVNGRLAGLLFLRPVRDRLGSWLEIRYLATRPGGGAGGRGTRGTGSLLVAGAWLLWRLAHPRARGLVLASELGAIPFYEAQGFRRRRGYEYILDRPRGSMLRSLIAMANRSSGLPPAIAADVARHAARQARALVRACPVHAADWERSRQLAAAIFFEECFRAGTLPAVQAAAARALVGEGQGKELCERLLVSAAEYGLVQPRGTARVAVPPVLVVLEDRFAGHLAQIMHPESPGRLRALEQVLADPLLAGRWRKVPARRATFSELLRVHTREHVQRIALTAECEHTVLDPDTEATAESFETARLAVGGLLNLLDALMAGPSRRGFAFVRPPGHHAEPDRARGFCLFNNVALGARHLLERHGLSRIMIVDVDAHHGNGTQAAFLDTDAVLFVSLHRAGGFPGTGGPDETGTGRGAGHTVNIPLPPRQGDAAIATVLHRIAGPLAHAYRPDFFLVSCGFDLYERDPLGGMGVTPGGYALLASLLCASADEVCGGRIAFVLEGGYSREGIRACGLRVMQALCDDHEARERLERFLARPPRSRALVDEVLARLACHWKLEETGLSPDR